jgi:glycosyltransferase involved in cell wall biosynthesis
MPDWLKQLEMKNVVIEGEVPDSHQFINSKSIMIVPLSSGGGMRVKIIEGMALGKTIVSTAVGAEGIEYENGKNIVIANTEIDFVNAIDTCLSDPAFAQLIGSNARKLVEEKYDNQNICNQLSAFYKSLING